MADLSENINTAATKPKKASDGTHSIEAHPIADIIAADRYQKTIDAAKTGAPGVRMSRVRPPNARGDQR